MSDSTTSIMPEALTTSRWEVVPQGFFSRHYDLLRGGQVIASLQMALIQEAGEFTIGGHAFAIRRESFWKDVFAVTCDDQPVCQVSRKFWSRQFDITSADQMWTLMRIGWFRRGHRLLVGEREVGTICPAGWFTRRRIAEFSDEVPLPIQVVCIFLVLIVSRREQQSAGS